MEPPLLGEPLKAAMNLGAVEDGLAPLLAPATFPAVVAAALGTVNHALEEPLLAGFGRAVHGSTMPLDTGEVALRRADDLVGAAAGALVEDENLGPLSTRLIGMPNRRRLVDVAGSVVAGVKGINSRNHTHCVASFRLCVERSK